MKFKIILISITLFFIPFFSNAQTPLAVPFGGPILDVFYCNCSFNYYVLVENLAQKLPNPMIYQPGVSRLNQNFNISTPTVNTLGTYTTVGICLIWVGTTCMPFETPPPMGTISPYPGPGVGTSEI